MTHKHEHIRSHRETRYNGKEMCTVCGHNFCWILAYYNQRRYDYDKFVYTEIGRFNLLQKVFVYSRRNTTKMLSRIDWGDFDSYAMLDDGVPF